MINPRMYTTIPIPRIMDEDKKCAPYEYLKNPITSLIKPVIKANKPINLM